MSPPFAIPPDGPAMAKVFDNLDWGFVVIAVLAAALTHLSAHAYRKVWRRRIPEVTPTGFGALMALSIAGGAVFSGATIEYLGVSLVVVAATALYWIDDVRGLGVRLRLAVQFVVGFVIASLLLQPVPHIDFALLAVLGLAGGVASVVLTNIVNFYDGADLNLAVFAFLTAACVLVFGASSPVLVYMAVLAIAFIVPFGIVNRVPKSLYLGDSGSFAFAALITIILCLYIRYPASIHPLIIAPVALPAFDTAFVFLLRLLKKEDLLSRNWHHLYQRLQIERRGLFYLIPQPVNLALIVGSSLLLESLGLQRFWAAALAIMICTPVFYFASRRMLLRDPWLG